MRNKNRKIIFSSIVIALFFGNIAGFFLTNIPITINNSKDLNFFPETSQFSPRNIRIAIYDDDNITRPSYASAAGLTNNHSAIRNALLAAGYDVSLLTTNQIYNHELKTAKYDVFIMADHLPRENITNHVKEFWLGGGALLSMDSAVNYICYAGILPPESIGDDGNSIYWTYQLSTVQNITARHPVSKAYALNDTFTISGSQTSATFSWTALQGTSIANEVVKVATRPGFPDAATVVAFDPQSIGGKVVHLPSPREIEDDVILIDAIEWLCPTPKGRILFDLAHHPYYGIDAWDEPTDYTPRFETLRNNIVNRSYTMDKFHSGNLTLSNLELYDLLIINAPIINFTSSEVSTVTNWINNGGNLLVLGIRWQSGDFGERADNINYLMSSFDLKINTTDSGSAVVNYYNNHPIVEGCTQLDCSYSNPGLITYQGSAVPIWGNDADNMIIGAQEYGKGRVILSADLFFLRETYINNQDNLQCAVNMINWLTSSNADILMYTTEPYSVNSYVSPVANALNILELPFYLTFDDEYLNLSLNLYEWDLIIIDEPYYYLGLSVYNSIIEYLNSGGKLLMSTYWVSWNPSLPIWSYLGFEFSSDLPNSSPIYIWESSHSIFNTPISYGANNYTPVLDYGDEGDLLTVLPNATALAGFTSTAQEGNASIVLRNDGKTLFNGYLIDEFSGDVDDSTYEDRLELWIAEIHFIYNYESLIVPTGGIPGFEIGLFLLVTFSTIGVISVIVVMKKKN
jgi:hypothetical protein